MMTMSPKLRKFMLTLHVASSVSTLGGVAGFLVLAIIGLTSLDGQTVRAMYIAAKPVAQFVILPLLLASLITGLVQSLGTSWGLFRHYWVLAKLLTTLFTLIVLLLQMQSISYIAAEAVQMTFVADTLSGPRTSLVVHAAGGLVVLLLPVVLSLYKPKGVTRYGWRLQQSRAAP